ncbi:MAG: DUF4268 domain-containing protein [Acidimicrobiia bacterium]|nr:DUF4268 domain-containing protein [Acidimicrobiia bacterium]
MRLGRIRYVATREIWQHEAGDFTPWLLTHSEYLAEALGIDLELERSEAAVGSFSVDLVGTDLTHDAVLIVENQLERTDHTHLGQLLTYAAGADAATVVWIASEVRAEHQQAINWLNERTSPDIRFFGIELRVAQIGDSEPAPLLDVVAEPNDWQKLLRSQTRMQRTGGKGQYYQQFWARYIEAMQRAHPDWSNARSAGVDNWMTQPCALPGTTYSLSFTTDDRFRHEIYIDSGDGAQNDAMFEQLLGQRAVLEAVIGSELAFEPLDNRRACRIALYRDGSVLETDRHDEFVRWFLDTGQRFRLAVDQVSQS